MVKHIPIFEEINKLGFLTTNSQAGKQRRGKKSFHTGKPYTIHERAYMDGFLQESHAQEFILKMALNTDKVAMYVTSCKDPTIPRSLDIPLTITESGGKKDVTTHMSTVLPEAVMTMFRKQVHLNKSEKVVYVFCWDPIWNRPAMSKDGLFRDILQALK